MLSPKDFETLRRKQLAANKLKVLIASSVKISNSEKAKGNEYQLLQEKVNEVINAWFEEIIKKSKIEILLSDDKRAF